MKKHNEGFSLVECLVAIVLLGALIVPICSGLTTPILVSEKTDAMLEAQLAVSSALEHLMATGVTNTFIGELHETEHTHPSYPGIVFVIGELQENAYYEVRVTDAEGLVEVTTFIRNGGA